MPGPSTNGAPSANGAAQGNGDHDPADRDDESLAELIQALFADASEARAHLKTLGAVRADRAKLRIRSTFARVRKQALLWLVTATLTVCAISLCSRGFGQLLTWLFRHYPPGVGELVAGLTLIAGLTVWLVVRASYTRRKELETHLEKYARLEADHLQRFDPARGSPAPDAGGVVGPAGGPGPVGSRAAGA